MKITGLRPMMWTEDLKGSVDFYKNTRGFSCDEYNEGLGLGLASIESYDFGGDLYGDVLQVSFLYRIRDERKFSGIDELKARIGRDSRRAMNYFSHEGVKNMLDLL